MEEWEQPKVWETPGGIVRTPENVGEGQRAQGALVNTAAPGRIVLDFVAMENPLVGSGAEAKPSYEVVSRVWMASDDAAKLLNFLGNALSAPPGQIYVEL